MLKLWQLSFSVVCVPARRYFLERRLVHTIIFSFPPGELVGEGTFPFLEKKKEEKIKIWSLKARYCLPGASAAQSVR